MHRFAKRIVLADQARELGKRIVSTAHAPRLSGPGDALTRAERSSAMIFGHAAPRFLHAAIDMRPSAPRAQRAGLSHFVRSPNTHEREPGRENSHDPLHESKPRRSRLWIILDNE